MPSLACNSSSTTTVVQVEPLELTSILKSMGKRWGYNSSGARRIRSIEVLCDSVKISVSTPCSLVPEEDHAVVELSSTALSAVQLVPSVDDAMMLLMGTTIDYVKELGGSYLKVINPNATASCGCGESFAV